MNNKTIKQKIQDFLKALDKKIAYSLAPPKPVLIPIQNNQPKNKR